jgi:hypothetical protein
MQDNFFFRGLNDFNLKKVIDFLKQDCHKQITGSLGKYQLCIRDNYINIYSDGCSLLKYCPGARKNILMIHYKYLKNPTGTYDEDKPYVSWPHEKKIDFNWLNFREKASKEKEKSAIAKYLHAQKDKGCFIMLDLEIAFTRRRDADEIKEEIKRELVADRIDMACIYLQNDNPILRLIEVKLTDDDRLKSDQTAIPYVEPKIIKQMQHYQNFIDSEKMNIKDSYQLIANNYLELIKKNVIPYNYFSSVNGLMPVDILQRFARNPEIDEKPNLLLLGKNHLTKRYKCQDHWKKLQDLFKENEFSLPELWPKNV